MYLEVADYLFNANNTNKLDRFTGLMVSIGRSALGDATCGTVTPQQIEHQSNASVLRWLELIRLYC